jgi:fructuronate reductase
VQEHGEWTIAAFTGRSPHVAEELSRQDCLYSLVERSGEGDRVTLVTSIVEAHPGSELTRFVELASLPTTAIITLTVTESGYRLHADGHLDPDDEVLATDTAQLIAEGVFGTVPKVQSTVARLVVGLAARARSGAGPIAVVPCDNVPDNGRFLRTGVLELAERVHPPLVPWILENVSFVSTSVDRITPRTTPEDLVLVRRLAGWDDRSPVVTEPFSDWVLSGEFPAGRPAWEQAGARFVDDIAPYEQRKLLLLNGAHTLMAVLGPARGHDTVAGAIGDPELRDLVEAFWDEAQRCLPTEVLDLQAYRDALFQRFSNARIEHRLEQIAQEGEHKVRLRIVPVVLAARAEGTRAPVAETVLTAWLASEHRLSLEDLAGLDPRLVAHPDLLRSSR